jgi:hypothetical protein
MVSTLNDIEFHDLPIKSLNLDFNENNVLLIVYRFKEGSDKVIELSLLFHNVLDFFIEKMDRINVSEIYNCDIKEIGDRKFIEFTMLYSLLGTLSVNMSFSYKSVEISGACDESWYPQKTS